MTLKKLAEMIPDTTPIRVYVEHNPYKPLLHVIYSNVLKTVDVADYPCVEYTVTRLDSANYNDVSFLVVHVK